MRRRNVLQTCSIKVELGWDVVMWFSTPVRNSFAHRWRLCSRFMWRSVSKPRITSHIRDRILDAFPRIALPYIWKKTCLFSFVLCWMPGTVQWSIYIKTIQCHTGCFQEFCSPLSVPPEWSCWPTPCSMVCDWRVSTAGKMLFYWPKLLYLYYSLLLFFPFSSSSLYVGWNCAARVSRTDRVYITLSQPCTDDLF